MEVPVLRNQPAVNTSFCAFSSLFTSPQSFCLGLAGEQEK